MMFQLPEGTRLSERVEARNRLLQTYDEEVTIRRTLPRASRTGGFQAAEEKTRGKTTGQPSFLSPVSETPALRRRCWLRRWRWGRSRRRLNWRTRWRRNGRSLRFCRSGRSSRCGLLFHQLTPERALPAFTSTFVVCAPKMFSVTPPPNAAPKPSLFGRCIKITSTMIRATRTKNTDIKLIRRFIGARNISETEAEANAQRPTSNAQRRTSNSETSALGVGRWTFSVGRFFDLIPNLVHLRKIDVAQFFSTRGQFVL